MSSPPPGEVEDRVQTLAENYLKFAVTRVRYTPKELADLEMARIGRELPALLSNLVETYVQEHHEGIDDAVRTLMLAIATLVGLIVGWYS